MRVFGYRIANKRSTEATTMVAMIDQQTIWSLCKMYYMWVRLHMRANWSKVKHTDDLRRNSTEVRDLVTESKSSIFCWLIYLCAYDGKIIVSFIAEIYGFLCEAWKCCVDTASHMHLMIKFLLSISIICFVVVIKWELIRMIVVKVRSPFHVHHSGINQSTHKINKIAIKAAEEIKTHHIGNPNRWSVALCN